MYETALCFRIITNSNQVIRNGYNMDNFQDLAPFMPIFFYFQALLTTCSLDLRIPLGSVGQGKRKSFGSSPGR